MKSGSSDPFADEPTDNDEADAADSDSMNTEPTEQSDAAVQPASNTEQSAQSDYPFKLRRNNVKDERDNVHQLFVLDDTDTEARDAERDLEDRLGEDVYRLDAREAIYLAGMQNLDDAAAVLREWGYDL